MNYLDIVLWVVAVTIVICATQPAGFIEFKGIYAQFLEKTRQEPNLPPGFDKLKKRVLLTTYRRPFWSKELGYNMNKGGEISVCADSDPNSMVHVLIHELAHSTVTEYKHNQQFHDNMKKVRQMFEKWGLYTPVKNVPFCGIKISD
jgi:hypothetical protein